MLTFWLCFVPLFVAVDALGVLPLFLSLTADLDAPRRRTVVYQSVVTATAVAILFLFLGTGVLRLLGITIADFMVAGGVLLFVISMSDLVQTEKAGRAGDVETLGAVPIGVPLITGPAVLTTSILLMNEHGGWVTGAAVVANIMIAGIVFLFAGRISRVLGHAGSRTVSKIARLLLAAIAVMMVRRGIFAFLQAGIRG